MLEYLGRENVGGVSKQDKTESRILEFLKSNPESRNTAIWKHIKKLKEEEDLVSEKIFNRILEALCKEDNGIVTKITIGTDADGKKITDRVPRYSLTEHEEREAKNERYYNEYAENITRRIESLEQNLPKLKDDELSLQLFYFYSVLNRLSLIWRIRLEQVGPSREMTKYVEETIPQKLKHLSSIVNKLPAEQKKCVWENLIRKVTNENALNVKRMKRDIEDEIGTERYLLPEWNVLDRERWEIANKVGRKEAVLRALRLLTTKERLALEKQIGLNISAHSRRETNSKKVKKQAFLDRKRAKK